MRNFFSFKRQGRSFMALWLALLFMSVGAVGSAQWTGQDIGDVGAAGNTNVISPTNVLITGSGADIWGTVDEFHYAYQELIGDATITLLVSSFDSVANEWQKAGPMIRQSLDAGSTHAFMAITAGQGVSFQRRPVVDAASEHTQTTGIVVPRWLRLVRAGDTFTAFHSEDGLAWTEQGTLDIVMSDPCYIGMAVTSHSDGASVVATFNNIDVQMGSAPRIDVTPSVLDFGFHEVGAAVIERTIDISNGGSVGTSILVSPLNVSDIGGFQVVKSERNGVAATYPVTLTRDGNDVLTVTVSYNPAVAGKVEGTIHILSNDADNPDIPVTMSGGSGPLGVFAVTDGLQLHLDAGAIEGLSNGNPVSTWNDKSAAGRDAVQADLLSQPLFIADGVNGLPVVRFDGANDIVVGDMVVDGLTEMTIFIVCANATNAGGTVEYPPLSWNEDGSWGQVALVPRTNALHWRFGTSTSGNNPTGDREVPLGSAFSVSAAVKNGAVERGFANGEMLLEVTDQTEVLANNTDTFGIGGKPPEPTHGSNYFNGEVAEVLVYDRALTDAELNSVGYYLQSKYGVGSGYRGPDPMIVTSAARVDYSILPVGSAAQTAMIQVTNDGLGSTLILSEPDVTNLTAAFTLDSVMLNGEVVASYPVEMDVTDVLAITVGFVPGAEGVFSGSFDLDSNDPDSPKVTIPVWAKIGEAVLPPVQNGLVLAAAADNMTGGVGAGERVDIWRDWSGNGNHLVRQDGAPEFVPGVLGGLPVVRFLSTDSAYMSFPALTNCGSVFLVLQEDDPSAFRALSAPVIGAQSGQGQDFHRGAAREIFSVDDSDPLVLSGRTYLNGGLVDPLVTTVPSAHSILAIIPGGPGMDAGQIGGDGNYANSFWDGDYAEVLIYNRALGDVELARVGAYLQTKWGIAGSFVAPSPQADMVVEPALMDLGLMSLGMEQQTYEITVRNYGFASTPLTISQIPSFSGSTDLVVLGVAKNGVAATAPFTLEGEGVDELIITVGYTPTVLGAMAANLTIVSNAGTEQIPFGAYVSDEWVHRDVGNVAAYGSASVSADGQTISVTGSGADIWGAADEFHYVYKRLSGDAVITARVVSGEMPRANEWTKAGVMMRQSLNPGSPFAGSFVTGHSLFDPESPPLDNFNGYDMQYRTVARAAAEGTDRPLSSPDAASMVYPYWVRAERAGDTFTAYYSQDGTNWTAANTSGTIDIEMGTDIYIGLAVTSHSDGNLQTWTFDNVTITGTTSAPALDAKAYVALDATGANDGSSWENAFTDIGDAMDAVTSATNPAEIWVKAGTYLLDGQLMMLSNVELLGGFNGTEMDAAARDPQMNVTLLLQTGSNSRVMENWYKKNTIIDGFTFAGANRGDWGAGYRVVGPTATHVVRNIVFGGNYSSTNGGGLAVQNGTMLVVSGCSFVGNSVSATVSGAAAYVDASSDVRFENCLFSGNYGGGSPVILGPNCEVVNSTFLSNVSVTASPILGSIPGGLMKVTNLLFAENVTEGALTGVSVVRDTCLFGDTILEKGGSVVGGADVSGDPKLAAIIEGTLAMVEVNGPVTYLVAEGAPLVGAGSLVGRLVDADTAQGVYGFIVANTGSQMTVMGLGTLVEAGATFKVYSPALTDGSAAIDAGKAGVVDVDIYGTTRPQGAGIDIGAIEYVAPAAGAGGSMFTATDVSSGSQPLGVQGLIGLAGLVTTGTESASVVGLKVNVTSATVGDVTNVLVYIDNDANGVIDGRDTLLGEAVPADDLATVFFIAPQTLILGFTTNWIVGATFGDGTVGKSISFSIASADYLPGTGDTAAQTPSPFEVVFIPAPDQLLLTGAAVPAGGSVTGLTAIMSLDAEIGSGFMVAVESIAVGLTGGTAADTELLFIYDDVNDNGVIDPGEAVLGTGEATGPTVTILFSVPQEVVSGTAVKNWLLAGLFNGSAGGKTITASVGSAGVLLNAEYGGQGDTVAVAPTDPVTASVTIAGQPTFAMRIAFPGYTKETTLNDFPVLVQLQSAAAGGTFNYTGFADQAAGGDMRFTTGDRMTEIPHEIESWDPAGTSLIWVRVPELMNSTSIWMFWGSNSIPARATVDSDVWSAGYEGVWHMSDTDAQDSGPAAHHGTGQGGMETQEGVIGTAGLFNGTDAFVEIPDEGDFDFTVNVSVEAWFRADGFNMAWAGLVTKGDSAWRLHRRASTNNMDFVANYGADNAVIGIKPVHVPDAGEQEWHHVVATYDGSVIALYIDGELDNSEIRSGAVLTSNHLVNIGNNSQQGNRWWYGGIDEVRISPVGRSEDWAFASYQTVANNDTFLGYGSIVTAASAAPIANAGLDQTVQAGTPAMLSGAGSSANMSYAWSLVSFVPANPGASAVFATPAALDTQVDFAPTALGVYTVRLTVSNGLKSAADTVVITVENDDPSVNAGHDVGFFPADSLLVQLDGSAPDDFPAEGVVTTEWTVVGAGAVTFITGTASDLSPVIQMPADAGVEYVLRLTATDSLGASAFDDVTIRSFTNARLYVDKAAAGTGSGEDWTNALTSVDAGIDAAERFTIPEVWVATGNYSEALVMPTGVAVYGGFAGGETELAERDVVANFAVIDASKAVSNQPADHVVLFDNVSDARLDGFVLKGGNANGVTPDDMGGGVLFIGVDSSCVLANCTVWGNTATVYGGGVAISEGSPVLEKCMITANNAANGGGVALVEANSTWIEACNISGNQASNTGGGMVFQDTKATVVSSIIGGNKSVVTGGGISCLTSSPSFGNCTIKGNNALFLGGGVFCFENSDPIFINSIFERNINVAVYEFDPTSDPQLQTCLFWSNTVGDCIDFVDGVAFVDQVPVRGAAGINAIAEATACISGNPLFVMNGATAITGTLTANGTYSAATNLMTLSTSAALTPDALVGDMVRTSGTLQALIVSNTANSMQVAGNLLVGEALASHEFRVVDVRIERTSPAVDVGQTVGATSHDYAGVNRPVDVPGVGAEATDFEYDLGAFEFQKDLDISVTPLSLGFGDLAINAGVSAVKSIVIQNNGTGTMTFTGDGVVLQGANMDEFAFVAPPDVTAMAPGASRLVQVTFDPETVGNKAAQVVLTSVDPDEPTITVNLTGTGTPVVVAPPSALDLVAVDDMGPFNTDNITNLTTLLTITGTAPSTFTVRLKEGATVLATGTGAEFASPGLDIAGPLTAGSHSIVATVTDGGGNESAPSAPLSISVDTVVPTVTSVLPATTGPTSSQNISFTVLFSENVYGFTEAGDVTVTHDAGGTTSHAGVTITQQTPQRYQVTLTGATGLGSLTLSVNADACEDIAGNKNEASALSQAVALDPQAGVTYTLTVIAPSGTVTKTPDLGAYDPDTVVSVNLVVDADYHFEGWSGDASGMDIPLLVTMDSNKTITAIIVSDSPDEYTLTTNADHGSIVADPVGPTYAVDTVVELTATADVDYEFVNWTGDIGDAVATDAVISVTMDQNRSVTANFAEVVIPTTTYTLTLTPSMGGSVVADPEQDSYLENETVTLTATPEDGYVFAGWIGHAAGTSTPLVVTMDSDKTIGATFAVMTFSLTTVATSGTVTVDPELPEYEIGSTVTLTAAPADGFKFVAWTGDADATTNPLVVTMDSDKNIEATFEALPELQEFTLTLTAGAGGSAVAAPVQVTYTEGSQVTLTATPAEGYDFAGWTGDVTDMMNPLVLTMDADTALEATFVIRTYALTVAATNGSVSVNPDTPMYDHGTTVSLMATADANYSFTGWVGADVPAGSEMDNPLVLTMDAAKSVEAMFTIDTWNLTVETAEGGAIAFAPVQSVYDHGSTVSLTATPDEGWIFMGWTGDASGEETKITLTITGDITVGAMFRQLPDAADYKVTYKNCTVEIDDDGNMTLSGTSDKSSLKIAKLKKPPKSTEPKAGKYLYAMGLRVIPEMVITGPFGKLYTDVEVWNLTSAGAVKGISTKKANIAWIEAPSVGGIKNMALFDATTGKTAACTVMLTGSGAAMKVSFTGIVLENLVSNQPLKSLTVASKAFKSDTKAKLYSIGGVGAVARVVAQAAGEANVLVEGDSIISAPAITTISAKVAPFTPDTVDAGLSKITVKGGSIKTSSVVNIAADLVVRRLISSTPMKSITAKAKKVSGVMVGGNIGVAGSKSQTRIEVAGDIKTITGQNITAIIWAGFTGDPATASHTGLIKKITAKGTLAGEAHVSADTIKVKAASSTDFVVVTQ